MGSVSMSHELNGLNKIGGISFIISVILFFLKYLLDLMAGSAALEWGGNPRMEGVGRTSFSIN